MKFHSKPLPEHDEVPLPDEGRLEEIVEHWTKREELPRTPEKEGRNSCYVVSVGSDRDVHVREAQLAEIVNLVRAQGDSVVGSEIYHLSKINPRTVLGSGTAQAIATRARACNADMLVLDAELRPSQLRNLEDAAGIPICDREAVILNVFLRHAKTNRARIQVEIAQLEYLRPRIRGIGINMDQQTGGIGGSRGPGETASELLARKLDGRLVELKKAELRLERAGETRRKGRDACARIVLVGYTNAGKTSLMNGLTSESLSARDMPFETLDTTSRCLTRHGGDVLLSDTVGFIRRLPESLLASFESTLAEIREASLLLIVVDASDYEWVEQLRITVSMLEKLKAQNIPRFYVFNKADRIAAPPTLDTLMQLSAGHPYTMLSSHDEDAVVRLKEALLEIVRSEQRTEQIFVPYTATRVMALVYGKCRIIESESVGHGLNLCIQGEPVVIAEIHRHLKEISQ